MKQLPVDVEIFISLEGKELVNEIFSTDSLYGAIAALEDAALKLETHDDEPATLEEPTEGAEK